MYNVSGRDLHQGAICTTKINFASSPSAHIKMPPRKSQTQADNDKRIKKALDKLSKGEFKAVRKAARHNNVCRTNLLRRLEGGKSTAESREDQQHLTIPEENALVEWITHLTACGHPPRNAFIRELAQEIQSSALNTVPIPPIRYSLGTTWVQDFYINTLN